MAPLEVPEELYCEILLLLPVNSLLRFRCISKSLRTTIDSSYFINSHLNKSSQNLNFHKLIYGASSKFHVCDVNLEEEVLGLVKTDSFSNRRSFFYGHCNGLLLMNQFYQKRPYKLVLWNPSTRQRRNLPDFPFDDQSCNVIGTGLGYDDSVDDYKAVIIVNILRKLKSEIQVWIFGLKSNIWKKNQNFPLKIDDKYLGFPEFGHFCVDGSSLNWLFTHESNIVTFDVRKETFSLVSQPVCSINSMEEEVETKLHVLSGCLSINYILCPTDHVDFYMRKKDGVDKFNWIKLFSITEPLLLEKYVFEDMSVLGYSNKGGKILLVLDRVVSYDLKDGSLSEIEVDVNIDWMWYFKIMLLKSLVSVAGGA